MKINTSVFARFAAAAIAVAVFASATHSALAGNVRFIPAESKNETGTIAMGEAQPFPTIRYNVEGGVTLVKVWVATFGSVNALRTIKILSNKGEVMGTAEIDQTTEHYYDWKEVKITVGNAQFPGTGEFTVYAVANGYEVYNHEGRDAGVYVGYVQFDGQTQTSGNIQLSAMSRTIVNGTRPYLWLDRSSEIEDGFVRSGQREYLAGYLSTIHSADKVHVKDPEIEVEFKSNPDDKRPNAPVWLKGLMLISSTNQPLAYAPVASYVIDPRVSNRATIKLIGEFTLPNGASPVFLYGKAIGRPGVMIKFTVRPNQQWKMTTANLAQDDVGDPIFSEGEEVIGSPLTILTR